MKLEADQTAAGKGLPGVGTVGDGRQVGVGLVDSVRSEKK